MMSQEPLPIDQLPVSGIRDSAILHFLLFSRVPLGLNPTRSTSMVSKHAVLETNPPDPYICYEIGSQQPTAVTNVQVRRVRVVD